MHCRSHSLCFGKKEQVGWHEIDVRLWLIFLQEAQIGEANGPTKEAPEGGQAEASFLKLLGCVVCELLIKNGKIGWWVCLWGRLYVRFTGENV